MNRLVVVSNRVPKGSGVHAGGLAAAMCAVLKHQGGLWFGWSGQCIAINQRTLHRISVGAVEYALLDLSRKEYEAYYLGFANRTLWPLFHFQPTLMQYSRSQYEGYRAVNRLFAQYLARLLSDNDRIWIHDYHLIPLAAELRALGLGARIGFFLHIPLPPPELLINLPCHIDLMTTLTACDLIGVQVKRDEYALFSYFVDVLGAARSGAVIQMNGRHTRISSFPVSIDTAEVKNQSRAAAGNTANRKLRDSLSGRKLIIGVDRLDYSKGLPRRFDAFGRFLAEHREWRSRVSLLQIAPPSRDEVPEYSELRSRLEHCTGATNGHYADPDWVPIRYVNRSFSRSTLAGFYRAASVGLMTPLRDGMNLVAKEYVAAQPADNPGVLVLSHFAGVANELPQAIVVNPYDPDDMVNGIEQGLTMSFAERRERWVTMYKHLLRHNVAEWSTTYLNALEKRNSFNI